MKAISENIENIKNPSEISNNAEAAIIILKKAKDDYIKNMNNKQMLKKPNEAINKNLYSLVGDYWELVDSCRKFLKKKSNPIALRVVKDWEEKFYPLIQEVNKLIDEWNIKHNTSVPKIEQRVKLHLKEEVKYFDY